MYMSGREISLQHLVSNSNTSAHQSTTSMHCHVKIWCSNEHWSTVISHSGTCTYTRHIKYKYKCTNTDTLKVYLLHCTLYAKYWQICHAKKTYTKLVILFYNTVITEYELYYYLHVHGVQSVVDSNPTWGNSHFHFPLSQVFLSFFLSTSPITSCTCACTHEALFISFLFDRFVFTNDWKLTIHIHVVWEWPLL